MFLTLKKQDFQRDITTTHLLLGYKPLIIGVPVLTGSEDHKVLKDQNQICLNLTSSSMTTNYRWRDFPSDRNSVARLILRKQKEKELNEYTIMLYEGEYGEHALIHKGHQFINRHLEKMQVQSADNISLPGNLWDQVRIAYSIPRRISVITVSNGSRMNMFPTDLHGPIGNKGYAGSLRIHGRASGQVETYKRIVISTVEATSFQQCYAMGKNHMTDLKEFDKFSIFPERSHVLGFPLPDTVVTYRELKLANSLVFGIHRIHFYEVLNEHIVRHDTETLGHIHQYYAQWRIDHALDTSLYFRSV